MLRFGRAGFLLPQDGWVREEAVVMLLGHDWILCGSRLGRCYVWWGEVVIWGVAGGQTAIIRLLFFLVSVLVFFALFFSTQILVEVRAKQLCQTRGARMFRVVEVDSDGGEPCGVYLSGARQCWYDGRLVLFCDRVHAFRRYECAVVLHRCCHCRRGV